jgi:hypothetical protein
MSYSKFGKRKAEHKINKKISFHQKSQLSHNSTVSGDMKINKSKSKLFHHSSKKKIWIKSSKTQTDALNKFQTICSSIEKLNYST